MAKRTSKEWQDIAVFAKNYIGKSCHSCIKDYKIKKRMTDINAANRFHDAVEEGYIITENYLVQTLGGGFHEGKTKYIARVIL